MCKYLVIINDVVEYTIIVSSTKKSKKYSLYYSDAEVWSDEIKNSLIMTISDNDTGLMFDKIINKNIEYSKLIELNILTSFILDNDANISDKYKFIKE